MGVYRGVLLVVLLVLALGSAFAAKPPPSAAPRGGRRPAVAASMHHYNGGALHVSSEQLGAQGSSWLIQIAHGNIQKSVFDVYYDRHVAPAVVRSTVVGGVHCTFSGASLPHVSYMAFACPTEHHALDKLVANLKIAYGSSAVTIKENRRVTLPTFVRETRPERRATLQTGARWGLDRIKTRPPQYNSTYIYDNNGAGADIWVVDTGVRCTHVDLAGRCTWVANTIDGNDQDCACHGTHVAGISAGLTYGVAKGAHIFAVKVLDCSGAGTTGTVELGLQVVQANRSPTRVTIVNLSLSSSFDAVLNNAVTTLITGTGVIVCAAGGNDADDACNYSPSSATLAIVVVSTGTNDALSSFSNYGTCTNAAAPGEHIVSAWCTSDTATQSLSGTSMASPHWAGMTAMYAAVYPNKLDAVGISSAVLAWGSLGYVTGDPTFTPHPMAYSRLPTGPVPPPVPPAGPGGPTPPRPALPPPPRSSRSISFRVLTLNSLVALFLLVVAVVAI
jgi:subtilisin family serine protease